MKTTDEQLEEALASKETLEATVSDLSEQVSLLTQEKETLAIANEELRANVAQASEQASKLKDEQQQALVKIAELEATAKTAEEKAAEYYGAQASSTPANVTPAATSIDDIAAKLQSIKDPLAQAEFINSLTATQKQHLLKTSTK